MNDALTELAKRGNEIPYARGWVLSEKMPIAKPYPSWIETVIGSTSIYSHPMLNVSISRTLDGCIVILGEAIDVRTPDVSPSAVASRLLDSATKGDSEFYEDLMYLGGRHVLLVESRGEKRLYTDASGSRACFYSATDSFIAGSHAGLVSKYTSNAPDPILRVLNDSDEWKRARPARCFPGDLTEFRNIRALTPNVALTLTDRKITRFWPRQERTEISVAEASTLLIEIFRANILWARNRFSSIYVSATAGLDSRTTIAAFSSRDENTHFFTHSSKHPVAQRDADLAAQISKEQGFELSVIDLETIRANPEFQGLLSRNCLFPHSPKAVEFHVAHFDQNSVHFRSNLAEIGRSYYRKLNVKWPDPVSARALARAWRHMQRSKCVVDAFDTWGSTTGLLGDTKGFDCLDLFYWEHRMPRWYGDVTSESDIAYETISPFNVRILFEKMLCVSEDARADSLVQKASIIRMSPRLSQYPVNGDTTVFDRAVSLLEGAPGAGNA